jgi:hypothetical protein
MFWVWLVIGLGLTTLLIKIGAIKFLFELIGAIIESLLD